LSVTALLAAPARVYDPPTTLLYPPFWHTPLGIHRGTSRWLEFFLGKRTHFSSPQGLACAPYLNEPPAALSDDCRVTVLGVNSGLGHLIYNASMLRLDVLGDKEKIFHRPMGAALAPTGAGYVSDPAWPRVACILWQNDSFVLTGVLPPPPGAWKKPWGLALDSGNRLYVSDAGRNQIYLYTPQGTYVKTFGPALSASVRLDQPQALAMTDPGEPWSYYHNHYVYVVDQDGQRIIRFDPTNPANSEKIFTTAQLPQPGQPARLAWIALDFYDNLWVTDSQRGCIHKFDRHLNYLTSFGSAGEGDGRFTQPTGIAVYRHFGQVFVAEAQSTHYFWIGADILNPAPAWQAQTPRRLEIKFTLTEPSRFTLQATRRGTGQTLTLCQTDWLDSGPQSVLWNVPVDWPADFQFHFIAEATYSSATYFARHLELTWPESNTNTAEAQRPQRTSP
jgi:DNA-binding beta-propeller fold protein YncE